MSKSSIIIEKLCLTFYEIFQKSYPIMCPKNPTKNMKPNKYDRPKTKEPYHQTPIIQSATSFLRLPPISQFKHWWILLQWLCKHIRIQLLKWFVPNPFMYPEFNLLTITNIATNISCETTWIDPCPNIQQQDGKLWLVSLSSRQGGNLNQTKTQRGMENDFNQTKVYIFLLHLCWWKQHQIFSGIF